MLNDNVENFSSYNFDAKWVFLSGGVFNQKMFSEFLTRNVIVEDEVIPIKKQLSQQCRFLYSVPHASIASMIGRMDSPSSLNEYSTFGGTSG